MTTFGAHIVRRRSSARYCDRRGGTLMEIVVASAAATVLLGGLASALLIAGTALRPAREANVQSREAAQVVADLLLDLRMALSFSERTSTAVTFLVPDRDNDGVPETIRYGWSGTPGDPLTVQYNGGDVEERAADVQLFDFEAFRRDL